MRKIRGVTSSKRQGRCCLRQHSLCTHEIPSTNFPGNDSSKPLDAEWTAHRRNTEQPLPWWIFSMSCFLSPSWYEIIFADVNCERGLWHIYIEMRFALRNWHLTFVCWRIGVNLKPSLSTGMGGKWGISMQCCVFLLAGCFQVSHLA